MLPLSEDVMGVNGSIYASELMIVEMCRIPRFSVEVLLAGYWIYGLVGIVYISHSCERGGMCYTRILVVI